MMASTLVGKFLASFVEATTGAFAVRAVPARKKAIASAGLYSHQTGEVGSMLPPLSPIAGLSVEGGQETTLNFTLTEGAPGSDAGELAGTYTDVGSSKVFVRVWLYDNARWYASSTYVVDFGSSWSGGRDVSVTVFTGDASRIYVQAMEHTMLSIRAYECRLTPYVGESTAGAPVKPDDFVSLSEEAAIQYAVACVDPVFGAPSVDTVNDFEALIAAEISGPNRVAVVNVLQAVANVHAYDRFTADWVNPGYPFATIGSPDVADVNEVGWLNIIPRIFAPGDVETLRAAEIGGPNRAAVVAAWNAQAALLAPATVAAPQDKLSPYGVDVACAIAMQHFDTRDGVTSSRGLEGVQTLLEEEATNLKRADVLACIEGSMSRRYAQTSITSWSS